MMARRNPKKSMTRGNSSFSRVAAIPPSSVYSELCSCVAFAHARRAAAEWRSASASEAVLASDTLVCVWRTIDKRGVPPMRDEHREGHTSTVPEITLRNIDRYKGENGQIGSLCPNP